ncbi:MAG: hypothetical protein JOZ69_14230, partial [Myxococcales bacterium]|nr:hypothetical protein [Myxococcales bacterium]
MVLSPLGGDVWGWSLDVRFGGSGAATERCRLIGNGAAQEGRHADGGTWTATLSLTEGANDVFAECVASGRPPLRSRAVRYVERLPDAMRAAFDGDAGIAPASAPEGTAAHADGEAAVVYGVVPPRFGTPPLRAVTSALGDLADLGVTVVWLTPIFASTPGDFGYAVTDYLRVRADYGDGADLTSLVREAHRRGLRVILDLPMNDTSSLHPYFADAVAFGRASRYHAFYARDGAGNATHYFDWTNLPNLDYENAEVDRWMTYAAGYWLRAFHVDGYRVDAAWGVRTRSPDFLGAWTRAMRAIDPDALLVAEGSARDPFYVRHGFDAAYDWTDQVGAWAWADVFDPAPGVAARIERALVATAGAGIPKAASSVSSRTTTPARAS